MKQYFVRANAPLEDPRSRLFSVCASRRPGRSLALGSWVPTRPFRAPSPHASSPESCPCQCPCPCPSPPLLSLSLSLSLSLLFLLSLPSRAHAEDFTYNPPGVLVPGSGQGRMDDEIYAPGMRFPIQSAPAFANSQVWGVGGSQGPGGSQCDTPNFSYPWSDNYCETRQWDMPLCPSGTGHQGQDIRGATCDKDVHPVVASEAGTVTNVGSYSVYVTAADGTRYDYLHMGSVTVSVGDDVTKGQVLGNVSNEFGGTPTTVHLHFNLRQNLDGLGNVYAPPYTSLVASYQALVGPALPPPSGVFSSADCEALRGVVIPAEGTAPIDVRLYFDGDAGDGATVGHTFLSDLPVDAGCDAGCACDGSTCALGFDLPPPLSLFDGQPHTVRAYGSDGSAEIVALGGSPLDFTCAFEVPSGVKRALSGDEAKNAWRISSFWDELEVSSGVLAELADGDALPNAPRIVASSSAPDVLFVEDGGRKRRVLSRAVARAWGFDAAPESLSEAELDALPEGPAWPSRPVVLVDAGGARFLVDAKPSDPPPEVGGGGAGGAGGGLDYTPAENCSCETPGRSYGRAGWAFSALAALAALRRRRPRTPTLVR